MTRGIRGARRLCYLVFIFLVSEQEKKKKRCILHEIILAARSVGNQLTRWPPGRGATCNVAGSMSCVLPPVAGEERAGDGGHVTHAAEAGPRAHHDGALPPRRKSGREDTNEGVLFPCNTGRPSRLSATLGEKHQAGLRWESGRLAATGARHGGEENLHAGRHGRKVRFLTAEKEHVRTPARWPRRCWRQVGALWVPSGGTF